jgi:hypothetical protein
MAVEIRTGVVFTGSREGDAARRELPTFFGYQRRAVLVNDQGQALVNDDDQILIRRTPGAWDE